MGDSPRGVSPRGGALELPPSVSEIGGTMNTHRAISVALLSLAVVASRVAHAQDPHGKKGGSPPEAKPAPPPHAEKPHAEKPAPAPRAEKTAPAPHVEKS